MRRLGLLKGLEGLAGWNKIEDADTEDAGAVVAGTTVTAASSSAMGLGLFAKFSFLLVIVGAFGLFLRTRKGQRYNLLRTTV